tara:strand:- start:2 stop:136 length:135 start_codon:yes stop_codon:yes gene_type:complete
MTNLIKIANESIKLIKLNMQFATTQEEINQAVKTINRIRTLTGA